MRVLVFGDSIAQGIGDPSGGWVDKLKREYGTEGNDVEVFNLGVSGNISQQVLLRIGHEVEARRWPDDPLVVFVASGVNDVRRVNSNLQFSREELKLTYEKLLKQAVQLADKVIAVGLTPCVDERVQPVAWDKSNSWRNSDIKELEEQYQAVAASLSVPFIPLWQSLQASASEDFPDGLHPNTHAHEVIFDAVINNLRQFS